jgi:hypothetical protein
VTSCSIIYIYIYEIIEIWQDQDIKGIQLSRNKNISTIPVADDQVTTSDTEDNLLTTVYKLNKIITEYGLNISTDKSKEMEFKGRGPTGSKIVINNKIIEQVNIFNYLGNLVSYEKEDIENKITKF